MPEARLWSVLDQIGARPGHKVVVFTGGEPTLRREVLLAALRRAKSVGAFTRIVTNAWWAKTPAAALSFVSELKEAGLDEINTSYDDFHAEYADIDRIVNLVEAAAKLQMRACVGIAVGPKPTITPEQIRATVEARFDVPLNEVPGWAGVLFVQDYVTPTGTGEALDMAGLDAGDKLDNGCTEVMKTVSIHPTGAVKACCGHTQFMIPDLTIGDLKSESLDDMISRAQQNLVYWLLRLEGPKRLLQQIGVEGEYTSICHACKVLFVDNREKFLTYLEENADQLYRDQVLLGGSVKRTASLVTRRRDEVDAGLRRLAMLPTDKSETTGVQIPV
jgi:hypothetical protein